MKKKCIADECGAREKLKLDGTCEPCLAFQHIYPGLYDGSCEYSRIMSETLDSICSIDEENEITNKLRVEQCSTSTTCYDF